VPGTSAWNRRAAGVLVCTVVVALLAVGERLAARTGPFIKVDDRIEFAAEPDHQHGSFLLREVEGVTLWFREHPDRPPPAPVKTAFRIVLLGDSVLEPAALSHAEGTAGRLQQALDSDAGPGEYEVVNLAEGGWSTMQEAALFDEQRAELAADLVIVGMTYNDIDEFTHYRGRVVKLGFLDRLDDRPTSGIAGFLAAHSYLYNLAWLGIAGATVYPQAPDSRQAEKRLVLAPIERLADAVTDSGARLAIVCFNQKPATPVQRRDEPCELAQAQAWATEQGIPFLVANSLFYDLSPEKVWFDQVHLTSFGHEILTTGIRQWLDREGLLLPPTIRRQPPSAP